MPRLDPRHLRSDRLPAWVAASFALSTPAFLAAAVVTARESEQIGAEAAELSSASIPADSPLLELRADVRRLDVRAVFLASGVQPPGATQVPTQDLLVDQIAEVDRVVTAYVTGPRYSSELPYREDVRQAWTELQSAAQQVQDAASEGDHERALSVLLNVFRPAVDGFDEALTASISANVAAAHARARSIEAQWEHARGVALGLTALSTLLTLLSALAAVAVIRRQTRELTARAEESMAFAGRVAHDVLSPLSPIRVFLDTAARKGLTAPGLERAVPAARSSLARLDAVVGALLAFARAGARPVAKERCSVREVVRGVLADEREAAERSGIALEERVPASLEAACAAGVLSSVVSNLVRNAIRYMGETQERWVGVRATARGDRMRLEVHDSGPGIPEAWKRRIFEPLTQVPHPDAGGIGLGLATVQRLVAAHGGRVGVDSEEGHGARFWVELPRPPGTDAPFGLGQPVAEAPGRG